MKTEFVSGRLVGSCLASLLLVVSVASRGADDALFPFVLPWDDAAPAMTDLSGWLEKPAGRAGHVRIGHDAHFYSGEKRIRFLGVNVSFAGGMPAQADAEKIAARLAKFGVNVVRFHHMDTATWPNGIRKREGRNTAELDPEALDRLDYFIAELKKRGIYANINLLVGRRFSASDGLPAEIEKMDWKDQHVIGFWNPTHLGSQKEFARNLLTHVNPYTKSDYASDPAVAFVEINNENGLVHMWLGSHVDHYPEVFLRELQQQWNDWLQARYGTAAQLRAAWSEGAQPLGQELLSNGGFRQLLDAWNLERHAGAEAATEIADGAVEIRVNKPGAESWHAQLTQSGLKLEGGKAYTLSFRAKAKPSRSINVIASQAHGSYGNLGLSANVALSNDWSEFRFVFNAPQSDDRARISFSGFGGAGSAVTIANASLRPGGVEGLLANEEIGAIPRFEKQTFGRRTAEAQRDWMRFLTETEDRYWQAMYRFLKDELKVKGLIAGTIGGCSPLHVQAKLDWMDTHAYWQHPRFPGRPWDPANWIVDNKTMVNERGGTLPGLALKRVIGKPHAVTEYNHAAPNTFSSEGFLLLAAYAALQDWDAIYVYSYAHTRADGEWGGGRISSFFDIDQHPAKMATLVAAAALFRRGDVKAARQAATAELTYEREVDLLRTAGAWSLVDGSKVGLPRESALVHLVGITTSGGTKLPPLNTSGPAFTSDTGELKWDLSDKGRGVVTIDSRGSKGVIGFGAGKKFQLGDITIEPGETLQGGWSAITVSAMPAISDDQSGRLPLGYLITATGLAENTGMGWKNDQKNTVGRNWGSAPSLVEGIPATITFSVPADAKVQAWCLDERGRRQSQIPVETANGTAPVRIGPEWKTIWYEVKIQ